MRCIFTLDPLVIEQFKPTIYPAPMSRVVEELIKDYLKKRGRRMSRLSAIF